ncbi:MAG: TonB-dependent receptor, partial [Bacteroidales bacterium]|nr:TonB-dependent receptor [Bacteroidales bacterium]
MKIFKRKILILAISFLFISNFISAQNLNITIKDNKRQALPGATLELINISDSVSIFTTTNLNGLAVYQNISNGLYLLKVSFIGFSNLEKTISVKDKSRNFNFNMQESSISLEEVTIHAKKPMITQEEDKMVIDPEPMATTSTNTLEVLESTPGLYVDQDGGIFINGASPAAIYINGREQKMSTQDITNILRNLPPGSVQKIEILRTPSTKYDAASSGGIVNVILKKGVKLGRYGSANFGMNQGVMGNRFGGFSINSGGEKHTYYFSLNYYHRGVFEETNANRQMQTLLDLEQISETKRQNESAYSSYGISYDLNDKISFSYDGRINYSWRYSFAENQNLITQNKIDSIVNSLNKINNNSQAFNLTQDFGFIYKIDTIGSELDIKLSFNNINQNSDQDFSYNYFIPIDSILNGMNESNNSRQFLMTQADLNLKLPHKFSFETGVKSAYQSFGSNLEYKIKLNSFDINIPERESAFSYQENINAAYLQLSKTFFEKFTIKSGVRMEHTYMNGTQTQPSDTGFVINRVDLFPYVYLSRKVLDIMGLDLFAYMIYRRTITRPDYHILNPGINYTDEFMYEAGNPSLKPQFIDNFEINLSYNNMPLFAVGRSYTKDIFSQVVYQNPDNQGVLLQTYDNLGKSTETYLRGIIGIPPGGKYFFGLGGQYNILDYDGFYQGQPLNFKRGSWRFFTFHQLRLFKETKITLSGFMMLNGNWNFFELETFGGLNIGINQSFLQKRLNISINYRDILRSMENKFTVNQPGINLS